MGNLCCAREHPVQFFMQFFLTVFRVYGAIYREAAMSDFKLNGRNAVYQSA